MTSSRGGVVGASLVGSVLGGLVGGAVLYALTPRHLTFVGSAAGIGGTQMGLVVWLAIAVAMGLVFASIVRPALDVYTTVTSWLTTRIAPLRSLTRPLTDRAPIATTASGVGLLYGLVMGVGVGLVAVPAAVGVNNIPVTNTTILAGYAAFGVFLGIGYGLTQEGVIPVPSFSFISPTVRGTVIAPVLASVISGGIVYSQSPLYLRFLGSIAGSGSLTTGFGVWVAITALFGFLFAAILRKHALRGNGTTGYGTVYGIVLAVFVGLLGVPALVTATTSYELGFESVSGMTLVAFAVYGWVLGSVYGNTVNQRPLRPNFLVGRTRATVVSSLVAGAVAGAIIYQTAPVYMLTLGYVVGTASASAGFGAFIALSVLLGLGFATLPARRVERKDFPGQTGFKLGLAYGILVAIVAGLIVVPQVVAATTQWTPITTGPILGAYVLFGVVHGLVYGGIKAEGRVTPVFLQGRGVPVLGGVLVGGAAGAGVAYAASNGVYLLVLGGIAGSPSVTTGAGVFLGLCLLFGLLFVPLGARTVEYRVGLPRGLGVGLVYGVALTGIVGLFGIPALANAQGFSLAMPHAKPPVASYLVFGILFGGVYAQLRKRTLVEEGFPTQTTIGTTGQRAVVFGSLFGGSVGGLVVHHMVGPVAMRYFGAIVGYGGSASIGWGVWLGLSLLLGLVFAVAVGPRLSGYARSIDEFAEQDEDLDAVFGDLIDRAPITTSATLAGFVYGLIAAVAVGAIAVPLAVNTLTGPNVGLTMPVLNGYFLLAFIVYGLIMGMGYGVVKEF